MEKTHITQASPADIDEVCQLFDAYRVFYEQPSDIDRARAFVHSRLQNAESVILLARHDGECAGFVQLFPSFSSVSTSRIWILNDLYVVAHKRRLGIAEALIEEAARVAKRTGSIRLVLETAKDNTPAKSLYERLGWRIDRDFDRYSIELT